jgi:hypothetical protein
MTWLSRSKQKRNEVLPIFGANSVPRFKPSPRHRRRVVVRDCSFESDVVVLPVVVWWQYDRRDIWTEAMRNRWHTLVASCRSIHWKRNKEKTVSFISTSYFPYKAMPFSNIEIIQRVVKTYLLAWGFPSSRLASCLLGSGHDELVIRCYVSWNYVSWKHKNERFVACCYIAANVAVIVRVITNLWK